MWEWKIRDRVLAGYQPPNGRLVVLPNLKSCRPRRPARKGWHYAIHSPRRQPRWRDPVRKLRRVAPWERKPGPRWNPRELEKLYQRALRAGEFIVKQGFTFHLLDENPKRGRLGAAVLLNRHGLGIAFCTRHTCEHALVDLARGLYLSMSPGERRYHARTR